MMIGTIEEFKERFKEELADMTEEQIKYWWDDYLTDPMQFHPCQIKLEYMPTTIGGEM